MTRKTELLPAIDVRFGVRDNPPGYIDIAGGKHEWTLNGDKVEYRYNGTLHGISDIQGFLNYQVPQWYGQAWDAHETARNAQCAVNSVAPQQDTSDQRVDALLIGGNHLASALLGMSIDPTKYKSYNHILNLHGRPAADMWIAWRAIMDLPVQSPQQEATAAGLTMDTMDDRERLNSNICPKCSNGYSGGHGYYVKYSRCYKCGYTKQKDAWLDDLTDETERLGLYDNPREGN